MLEIILKLINAREENQIQVIPGYSNKPQPSRPFAVAYMINHKAPDEFSFTDEKKSDVNILETMEYWGDFTIQFDVIGNTESEAFSKARALKDLIMYKMRYQDWGPNNIGIANSDYDLKALHEKADTGEYIYRYSFDVTFESRLSVQRATFIAKTIELTLNDKMITIGGK